MGIRFHCPNGHRLNVKSYLAGKKGFCPQCGVKLVIPVESTAEAAMSKQDRPTFGVATPTDKAREVGVGPEENAQLGNGQQQGSRHQGSRQQGNGQQLDNGSAVVAVAPTGDAAWYVRPPSGGQFGPADTTVLNQWVAENRVPRDSLVWREGWPDWRPAADVIDQFQADNANDAPAIKPIEPSKTRPTTGKKNKLRTGVVIALGIIALLLLACLLLVLTSTGSS